MNSDKILITVRDNDVSPRFDLTTEVVMESRDEKGRSRDRKTLVLPHASSEELCHFILAQDVQTVVCGAIEEEYYQYLTWKKIAVVDSVMGPWQKVMERYLEGRLRSGDILHQREEWLDHAQSDQ